MGRIVKEFVVGNKLGIHARPAAMFVKVANLYKSEIFVEKDDERVNGKSIMGLMMLAAGPGCKVTVEIEERQDQALPSGGHGGPGQAVRTKF